MKDIKNIKTTDAEGAEIEVAVADYRKAIIREFKVKDFTHKENGPTTAVQVFDHIFKTVTEGKEIDEEIQEKFPELIERVTADVNNTIANSKSKAELAKEEKERKEAEKKQKEEEEKKAQEALAVRQTAVANSFAAGSTLAASEFKDELLAIQGALPEGVTVGSEGNGYGLVFGDDVNEETIGNLLGYLYQKSENNGFVGNQLHFWIGDAVSFTVAKGIYATAKEAAEKISTTLKEKHGKSLAINNIDSYKRMAERTPLALRNPEADPTAYLKISDVKLPKKGDKETDDQFKARLEKFEEGRKELQGKLAKGEILKRKDVVPLVQEFEYAHGLKERPDPQAPSLSPTQQLAIFFHVTFALEHLVGTHEDYPDAAVYRKGEKLYPVSKEDLEEQRSLALGNLQNIFIKAKDITPQEIIRGHKVTQKEVVVGQDGDGKPIKELQNQKTPVYPLPFWEVKEEEASAPTANQEEAKEETKEEAAATA